MSLLNNKAENKGVQFCLDALDEKLEQAVSEGVELAPEYDEAGSFQPLAADLVLGTEAGSDEGTDPDFLAGVMGHITGDNALEGNYMAGVIGANSTANMDSDYPTAGVMGIAMQGASGLDALVMAVVDGDDGGDPVLPNAAFGVAMNNNNAASGVNYGLDLKGPANPNYTGGGEAFNCKKAALRLTDDVCLLTGAGAPVDGTTGDDFAGPGSIYINISDGSWWKQTGSISSPTWVEMAEVP